MARIGNLSQYHTGVSSVAPYGEADQTEYMLPYNLLEGQRVDDLPRLVGDRYTTRNTLRLIARLQQQVHDAGFVHGDATGDNIVVLPNGGMRLIDWQDTFRAARPDGLDKIVDVGNIVRACHEKGLISAPEIEEWDHIFDAETAAMDSEQPPDPAVVAEAELKLDNLLRALHYR